ncbi:unnamed protein product [Prunus brigantina]
MKMQIQTVMQHFLHTCGCSLAGTPYPLHHMLSFSFLTRDIVEGEIIHKTSDVRVNTLSSFQQCTHDLIAISNSIMNIAYFIQAPLYT